MIGAINQISCGMIVMLFPLIDTKTGLYQFSKKNHNFPLQFKSIRNSEILPHAIIIKSALVLKV